MRISSPRDRNQYVISLIALMLIAVVGRAILTLVGSAELGGDPGVWKEMSSTLASGGAPYVDFPDNKPPLFIILVAIGSITDYIIVMVVAVAASNAILIQSIYKRLSKEKLEKEGVIAAAIATGAIILMLFNYRIINNKVISLAVLLLTLRSKNSTVLGTGVALSGLLAQQSMIAIPIIICYRLSTVTDTVKFFSGLVTAVVGYGIIGLVWGWGAFISAIDQSLLLIASYTAGSSEFGRQIPIWNDPLAWMDAILSLQQPLIYPAIASVAGLYYTTTTDVSKERKFEVGFLILSGFLLLVRPWWHYGYYSLIPLSLLGGYGIVKHIHTEG